jgi:hypothetical protein
MLKTRDPRYVLSKLIKKDNKVFTTVPAHIEIPKRFINRDLLEMKDQTYVVGVFALCMGDKYSVSLIPSMFRTVPLNIMEYKIGDVEYIKLLYAKDTCVIENTEVVRKDTLSYSIFDELLMAGKIPWYVEYEDVCKLLDGMVKYADSKVGINLFANEIIAAFVARTKDNMAVYYRTKAVSKDHDQRVKYDYNGIDDVFYSANNTFSKMAGNYYRNGVISALVQPEKTIGDIEKGIRQ